MATEVCLWWWQAEQSQATDHYTRLGINKKVSNLAMHSVCVRMLRLIHPDTNGGNGDLCSPELLEAIDVLSNPERRRAYDRTITSSASTATAMITHGPFEGRVGSAVIETSLHRHEWDLKAAA